MQSLPSFFWCLWKHGVSRVVEALIPKVRGNCQLPHSSKGGTCGRSENFSGEPLEPPWQLGCHCHHPSSLLLGHRLILPVEWCRGVEQGSRIRPQQTARDIVSHGFGPLLGDPELWGHWQGLAWLDLCGGCGVFWGGGDFLSLFYLCFP